MLQQQALNPALKRAMPLPFLQTMKARTAQNLNQRSRAGALWLEAEPPKSLKHAITQRSKAGCMSKYQRVTL
ncbi:hypothetical protein IBL26_17815 [Roseomonas aerophila]|uniref:Uncharacterized protein n=1 Tax=Teichococcus aerophilus TaxID=1224513 RepID=A0ABR7RQU4_9PROT|nr:hypothetical protein [Pseudoroseomonas aerophila]MBC9208711.1 hypothetical protein [Pseudoroseomonas aerophila]